MGRPKKNQESADIFNDENPDFAEESESGSFTPQTDLSVNSKNAPSVSPNMEDDGIQHLFNKFLTKELNITENKERIIIPTGLQLLDTILGGGITTHFSMFAGPPGGGKSTLLAKIISSAQQVWGNNLLTTYMDSESSTSKERLAELGVKCPMIDPINEVSIEKVFKAVEAHCAFKDQNPKFLNIPSIVAWDSIANTQTESIIKSEELSNTMGMQKAGIINYYLPKYITKMVKYNVALVSINQLRVDINMDGPYAPKAPKALNLLESGSIPGGRSLLHNAFHLVELHQHGKKTDCLERYGFNGIRVKAKCVKNKMFRPNIPISMVFSYTSGFSNFWTNYEMLCDYKYINAASYSKLLSCPEPSFRTSKALELYKENPKWKDAFDASVKECLQVQFVENVDDKIDA